MRSRDELKEEAHRLFQLAWREEEEGRLEDALATIERALELNPSIAVYWTVKGRFLQGLGRLPEAEAAALRSVLIDERNYHGWALLGILLGTQGRFEPAVEALGRAAKLKPSHHHYTLLAAAQIFLSPADAIESAERALAIEPDWEEAKRILEWAKEQIRASE